MPRQKQRLWDFAPKKKRKGITPQNTEKILMVLTSVVVGCLAVYFAIKLVAMLLE
jgi:hypothetical protein